MDISGNKATTRHVHIGYFKDIEKAGAVFVILPSIVCAASFSWRFPSSSFAFFLLPAGEDLGPWRHPGERCQV